ncbi:MAG: hypothetical protein ACXVBC_12790, partial [Bdellovibrionota bacterium]
PESCASILWSDSSLAERASEKLKMNPPDLLRLGVIDGVITEPKGGAHRDWAKACELVRAELEKQLDPLWKTYKKSPKKVLADRAGKFRAMGEAALAHAPVAPGP